MIPYQIAGIVILVLLLVGIAALVYGLACLAHRGIRNAVADGYLQAHEELQRRKAMNGKP